MQFTILSIATLAAFAIAAPVQDTTEQGEQILIHLPKGCTKSDLTKCILHLGSTTASCGVAVAMAGVDPVADISCLGSAAGTAASIDECKACIPKKN